MKNNNEKVTTEFNIPMEVTDETIRDFRIAPQMIKWAKIGSRKVRVTMIPVNENVYRTYMQDIWREEKRNQRSRVVMSLDEQFDEKGFDVANESSFENNVEMNERISAIYDFIDTLDETNQTILKMIIDGETEQAISKRVSLCQKTVNNRKHKLQERLRRELDKY